MRLKKIIQLIVSKYPEHSHMQTHWVPASDFDPSGCSPSDIAVGRNRPLGHPEGKPDWDHSAPCRCWPVSRFQWSSQSLPPADEEQKSSREPWDGQDTDFSISGLFDSFWGFFYLQTKLNNEMLVFSEKKKIMTILFGFRCYVSVFIFKKSWVF